MGKLSNPHSLNWNNDYQRILDTLKNGPVMHYKMINGVKVRIK